ncbi:ParA family protein [Aquisalimonas asiatica]|uniref:Chromosome partitioning related protein ParA n=1 Tax=Aquisalimonas asiatica TaxID=406100 RepID=A0A1H8SZB1_9GAMM|nr:ParA family protein [Aquisalimonas asiatica]SEO84219.1 chromosome partitioning related protein ParA [Aquisalimonas asiatica]
MAIKLTVTSTKGGVGKTTVTANLGAYIADLGYRVLLIDADIQPTLSSFFPLAQQSEYGLTELITAGETGSTVSTTALEAEDGGSLDIVLSNDPDGALQNWILHTPDGRVRLRHILSGYDEIYDAILIDTQGAVGPLQDAAVLAADLLLSPIPPEILSAREFARGTVTMLERLRPMAALGAPIGPLRGMLYRMDRTADARVIADELRRESYGPSRGQITVLDTAVPATVAYREAATHQIPVHRWETRRSGPTPAAAETMRTLAAECLPHLVENDREVEGHG